MNFKRFLAVSMMSFTSLAITTAVNAQVNLSQPGQPRSYIVVLKDNADPTAVGREHANAHALNIAFTYTHALRGYAARIPDNRLALIAQDPRVAFISEDRPVQVSAQVLPTGVNRVEADLSSTRAGDGTGSIKVPIAILDTGIDNRHPDLNVAGGKSCLSTTTSYTDGNGHGTHVAGIIAAKDDANGVVGVAPGAPLYAVRVLDSNGAGTWSSLICGIDWVTSNAASKGIKLANLSLNGSGMDDQNCGNSNNDALHKAICRSTAQGVTYIVAAGNESKDFANSVPASYNEVLTVTAFADFNGQAGGGAAATCMTDIDETAADFSNFTTIGSADTSHTIAAPGVCINSTWKGGAYNTLSGTSMATPHVTGIAALCLASGACNGLTPQGLITKLQTDAANQPANYGFRDDPNSPNGSRYYGKPAYAGSY